MAQLLTRKEGALGWIVFSNPARHNAVTYEMWRALPTALAAFDSDPDVRAVVMTGEGERAFVAGADISQFDAMRSSAEAQAQYDAAVEAAYEAPARCAKPVIAKIRGICMGGGLGLAAGCDVRLAAADAVFRMPAARLGLGYHYAGLKRFVDVMGVANTADVFLSARKFDAAEALRMGFVSRVIPLDEFDREVAAYAALVAENAPLTLAAAKRALREIVSDPDKRDLRALVGMVDACFASDDYREGRRAFAEKRAPVFKGR